MHNIHNKWVKSLTIMLPELHLNLGLFGFESYNTNTNLVPGLIGPLARRHVNGFGLFSPPSPSRSSSDDRRDRLS